MCLETLVIVCSDELLEQEVIYHIKQCYPNAPGKNAPYIFHKDFVQKKYTIVFKFTGLLSYESLSSSHFCLVAAYKSTSRVWCRCSHPVP